MSENILLIESMVNAVVGIANAADSTPEEVLESLPKVFERLEDNYRKPHPCYLILGVVEDGKLLDHGYGPNASV